MQYVPPTATGKNVSIVRTVVSSVSSGARRSVKHLIGTFTGQRWSMVTGRGWAFGCLGVWTFGCSDESGRSSAIVSVTV